MGPVNIKPSSSRRALTPRAHSPRALTPRALTPRAHSPRAHSPRAHSPRALTPRAHSPRALTRLLGCVSACCAVRQQRLSIALFALLQHALSRRHIALSRSSSTPSRGDISRSRAPARPLAATYRALALLQHALSRRHIALSRSSTPSRGDIPSSRKLSVQQPPHAHTRRACSLPSSTRRLHTAVAT